MSQNITQPHLSQCVIICGGADEPDTRRIAAITALYESSLFVGVDRGGLELIKAGYQLDYATGDFDSVTLEEKALIMAKSAVIDQHHSEKDDTDMELGLLLAHKAAPNADYFIFGGIGKQQGRLDHLMANIWLVFQPRFSELIGRLQFIEMNHRIHFLKPGSHTLQAAYREQYVSVFSLTAVKQLQIVGAKYELKAQDIEYPRALISNEFYPNKPIEVSFNEGLVMILHVHEER